MVSLYSYPVCMRLVEFVPTPMFLSLHTKQLHCNYAPSLQQVKSYLRYEPRALCGVICSPASNACWDSARNLAAVASLETVSIWNTKTGVLVNLFMIHVSYFIVVLRVCVYVSYRNYCEPSLQQWLCY